MFPLKLQSYQHPNVHCIITFLYTHAEMVFRVPPPAIQKKILLLLLAGSGMSRPSSFPSITLSPTLNPNLE